MTTSAPTATPPATGAATLNTLFKDVVARQGDRPALRRKLAPGKWEDIGWRAYRESARKTGLGLVSLGLKTGDRVAILSNSRVEWVYADLGILGVAGVAVPIYQSVKEDEV